CVMKEPVLPAPHVCAPAQQLQRHRHERVDPSRSRIRLMAAIMLNVESDPGDEETEENGERDGLYPRTGDEHQEKIRAGEAGEEDRRLGVHLPTVAWRLAAGAEVAVDPFAKSTLEGRIATECRSAFRLSGSKRPLLDL